MKLSPEELEAKGFVQGRDGSWSKSRALQISELVEKRPVKKRLRQDSKPLLNKLETQFYEVLKRRLPNREIRPQAIRFKLGNGIWFKPDFTIHGEGEIIAYEVKGPHAFRGGFENLKVVASLWPCIRWVLAWNENGEWLEQQILP